MPDNSLIYGTPATLAFLVGSGSPGSGQAIPVPNASAYVWNLWDSSTSTSNFGATRWPINRPSLSFTATIFDKYGRYVSKQETSLVADEPPVVVTSSLGIVQNSLPYSITLTASGGVPGGVPIFIWKDVLGNTLATSTPSIDGGTFSFTYLVTQDNTQLTLTVEEYGNTASQVSIDFVLPGNVNLAPEVSELATGLYPNSWMSVLNPAFLATTVPLNKLSGQPVIDGIQVPPKWIKRSSSFISGAPARMLVKSQNLESTNGIYSAETTQISYILQAGSGFTGGVVAYTTSQVFLSRFDSAGDDALPVILDHATQGRKLLIQTDEDNYIEFLINSVPVISSLGLQLSTSISDQLGSLHLGGAVTGNFNWIPAPDNANVEVGSSLFVVNGADNGNNYFSAIFDPQPDSFIQGTTPIVFSKAGVDYTGSATPQARLWFENSVSDPESQTCEASLDLITLTSEEITAPGVDTLVRAKVDTSVVAVGIYSVSEQVTDSSLVLEFQPETTTVSANVSVNPEPPVVPLPS